MLPARTLRLLQLIGIITINILLLCEPSLSHEEELSPIVRTKYGLVRGVKTKDHYEFRKIPYAKPPLQSLRFRPPEEPEKWNDNVLPADGPFPEYCIQYNVFWNDTEGIEDCLYINVFTPQVKSSSPLPVMVYIHSGGFMFGRGSHFKGDYLMETKDVVAVVFQYRLGSFGFLNTEDQASWGNMGMKDQVLALRWVQENIEGFGGDPGRVMIFGTSAGAASVHYHLLSPLSKGLFHTAFSGSGTALCPWAFQPTPKKNAEELGKYLNCPTESSQALVECLREKDASDIALAHSKFLYFFTDPIAAFGPSIEIGNADPSTAFLLSHPADIIRDGKGVAKVPWVVGFNTDEGWEHTLSLNKRGGGALLEKLNSNWNQLAPITLEYVHETEEKKAEISGQVKSFYFKEGAIRDNLKNLSDAYGDKTFNLGSVLSAHRHSHLHEVYLFLFSYPGKSSIVTLRGFPRDGFITNHMDDIQYLVNSPLFEFIDEGAQDKEFQRKYARMIVEFVKTGKLPPFDPSQPEITKWEPLDPKGPIKWFDITDKPRMHLMSEEWGKRLWFWTKLGLQELQGRTNTGSNGEEDEAVFRGIINTANDKVEL